MEKGFVFKDLKENKEMVNHPKHYNTGKFEVIEVIEDWNLNFNLGNAVKYISRCEHKGNKKQDLEKAVWYLQRELDKLRKMTVQRNKLIHFIVKEGKSTSILNNYWLLSFQFT